MPTTRFGATPGTRTRWPPTTSSASPDAASWPSVPRSDAGADPELLILLANLGRPRRPAGVAVAYTEPVLPDATVATAQLASVVDRPVKAADLADLRRLQLAAFQAAEAIV